MALQDDLRKQLIKQFSADVIIITENGNDFFACPICKHYVSQSNDKCPSCDQALTWDNVRKEDAKKNIKTKKAVLEFEVPGDFSKSDCRKCPISYIERTKEENIYECPLRKRNECPLKIMDT